MKVLVSGSHGLIGSALINSLTAGEHAVTRLTRGAPGPNETAWNPNQGTIDRTALEGFDAVVHLGGESIAGGRWSESRKTLIRDSRLRGTSLLAETLAGLEHPPQVFLSASAIGYYGSRGDEPLTEKCSCGSGFLAKLCREWETVAESAKKRGIRVVHPRFGIVLSPAGGMLRRILTPFKMGVGGVVGTGKQWMSWIVLDDVTSALTYCLTNAALDGPVNFVSPSPLTNRQFTETLGRVLRRPTILPAPAFALRAVLGEMADELLLSSQRAEPLKLTDAGYSFHYPYLENALRHVLG